jgi:hypothetical protein
LALRPDRLQLVIVPLNTSPRRSRIWSGMLFRPADSSVARALANVANGALTVPAPAVSLPSLLTYSTIESADGVTTV